MAYIKYSDYMNMLNQPMDDISKNTENKVKSINESFSINEGAYDTENFNYIMKKSVADSDGFTTDYTMYYDLNEDKFVFVFGDIDVYSPEDGWFDYETEDEEEAQEWFDSYEGFTDDMYEALNEKTMDNYNPKKTGTAYKVFKVKHGKLYPPMVANAGGADTPVGVWLEAEEGEFAGLSKTGRPQVKSTGSGKLAYRPGWHLGDIPRASQFDRTNKETGEKEFPKDFVWAECTYVMDVDYQGEADEMGYMRTKEDGSMYKSDKYQHSLAGLKKLPRDGFYKYRTNPNPNTVPWVITGAIKVNKLLDDYMVNAILEKNGIEPIHRQGGDKTLDELGLKQIGESLNNESMNEAYSREFQKDVVDALEKVATAHARDSLSEMDFDEAFDFFVDRHFNHSYTNEELDDEDFSDFKHDIYNALADVGFKYRRFPITQKEWDFALEFFTTHFFDSDDFNESMEDAWQHPLYKEIREYCVDKLVNCITVNEIAQKFPEYDADLAVDEEHPDFFKKIISLANTETDMLLGNFTPSNESLNEEKFTYEEAKEYWEKEYKNDPVLSSYDSFEEWWKDTKENGYAVEESLNEEIGAGEIATKIRKSILDTINDMLYNKEGDMDASNEVILKAIDLATNSVKKVYEKEKGNMMKENINEANGISKIESLAAYLDCPVEDITETDAYYADEFEHDGKTYEVYTGKEARKAVKDSVEEFIDDMGISGFSEDFKQWIYSYALDETPFEDAMYEETEYRVQEMDEQELAEAYEEYKVDNEEDLIDAIYNADYHGYGDSAFAWFKDTFGEKAAEDFADENQAFNYEVIIDEVLDIDAYGPYLATYDGIEIDLGNDFYAYRTD